MWKLVALVLGGWLVIAAFLSLRTIVFHTGLEVALNAISEQASDRREILRLALLGSNACLMGLAGVATLCGLSVAIALLLASLCLGLVLVFLTHNWFSLGLQGLALGLALVIDHGVGLPSFSDAPAITVWGFAVLSSVASVWLVWKLRPLFARMPTSADLAQSAEMEQEPEAELPPLPARILMAPSWQNGALFDAQNLRPIELAQERLQLPEAVSDLLGDWIVQFIHLADAGDPRRCALLDPASEELLRVGGEEARNALAGYIGGRELVYTPRAVPVLPMYTVRDLELRADQGCWALWYGPLDEGVGDVSPDLLGFSWGLARAIEQWGLELESPSIDLSAHDVAGRLLAERVAKELAATDRQNVRVRFIPILRNPV